MCRYAVTCALLASLATVTWAARHFDSLDEVSNRSGISVPPDQKAYIAFNYKTASGKNFRLLAPSEAECHGYPDDWELIEYGQGMKRIWKGKHPCVKARNDRDCTVMCKVGKLHCTLRLNFSPVFGPLVTTHAGEGEYAQQHKAELKQFVIDELKRASPSPVDYIADVNKDPNYLDDFQGPTKVPGGLFGQTKYLYTWNVYFPTLVKGDKIPDFSLRACEFSWKRFYPGSPTEIQP